MNKSIAVQLMIGQEELRAFGEAGILERLSRAEAILDFGSLFLSVGEPSSVLARLVVDRCRSRGASVALWTMVLADTGREDLPLAADASGRRGQGRLGAWSRLGSGPEKFLFTCPSHALGDARGPDSALSALSASGADAVFLDRIRYPSPANGMELMGSCGCAACRTRFLAETGNELPDLAALAASHARGGAEGAASYLEETREARAFRERTIASIVGLYASAARSAGARVGLDLFSPAIAGLVGADYGLLARHADFVKGMFYCKARGPACLPLELGCLVSGLVEAGVGRPSAVSFAVGLTGIPDSELAAAALPQGLPARAAGEYARASAALGPEGSGKPALFAGIELVDYPGYDTRIGSGDRDAYLAALAGLPIAVCWNIMYVPDSHLAAVREAVDGPASAPRKGAR